MTKVFFDAETRSFCDLPVAGAYNYAEHKTTEVLTSVWVWDDVGVIWVSKDLPRLSRDVSHYLPEDFEPERFSWTLHVGESHPEVPHGPGVTWYAHNGDQFDRRVWKCLGYPTPEFWRDTLKLSRRAGLPASLQGMSETLFGVGKHAGTATLNMLCKPHARTGKYVPLNFSNVRPLAAYNVQDVLIMRDAYARTLRFYEHTADDDVTAVDLAINDRGYGFDVTTAKLLIDIEAELRQRNGDTLEKLTDGEITRATLRSPKKLKALFKDRFGMELENTQKSTLMEILDSGDEIPELMELVIEARIAETGISSAKLIRGLGAAREIAPGKHVLHDLYAIHAADTGRWGGRVIQPQNLPRGVELQNLEELVALVQREARTPTMSRVELLDAIGAFRTKKGKKPTTSGIVGTLTRSCLIPVRRRFLVTADYSSVESRMLLWLAMDPEGLAAYRSGLDAYKTMAAYIFQIVYEEVTKAQRTVGKVPVLGCLAATTEVLTCRGWIRITEVTEEDEVWDGVEWVSSLGCIYKGEQVCQELADTGIKATPDHRFLTDSSDWKRCDHITTENTRLLSPEMPSATLPSSDTRGVKTVKGDFTTYACVHAGLTPIRKPGTYAQAAQPGAMYAQKSPAPIRTEKSPISHRYTEVDYLNDCGKRRTVASNLITLSGETTAVGVSSSVSTRSKTLCGTFLPSTDSITRNLRSTESTTTGTTSQETYGLRRGLSRTTTGAPQSVYDILECGPRNRFVCRAGPGAIPVISHNCGYGMGGDGLNRFAAGMGIDIEELSGMTGQQIVDAWRDMNWRIAGKRTGELYEGHVCREGGLWKAYHKAAMDAIDSNTAIRAGRCVFAMRGNHLHVVLPSQKLLVYRNATIEEVETPWGGTTTTWVYSKSFFKNTLRVAQTKGKITENITQALATGCGGLTGYSLKRLHEEGFEIVGHTHDDVAAEVDSLEEAERFVEVMAETPEWAVGFPQKVVGHLGPYLTKEPLEGWPEIERTYER